MHDRDALLSSLTAIARRMRVNTALREWALAACLISGTFLVYQILAVVIATSAVMSALATLSVVLVIVIVGFFVVRSIRPTSLAQAAAASDERANLNDELKTAYWFARQGETSPLIDLQIRRAARVGRELKPRKLFAIAVPRSAFVAASLALSAGILAWIAPRIDFASSSQANLTVSTPIQVSADIRKDVAKSPITSSEESNAIEDGEAGNAVDATWTKLEATVQSLGQREDLVAVTAAIKSRDAARAAHLLEELSRKRKFAQAQSAVRTAAIGAPASQDLLARLQELFSGNNAPQQDVSANDQLAVAVDIAQRLDQDAQARANNPANHSAEEETTNPLQAGVPLERFGPRETRRSQTQGGEFAGTTDVEGGAMGRRVTQTSIGAGGKPSGNETSDNNNIEAESVWGKRTMRLAAKLERIKIDGTRPEGNDAQGVTDAIYAATRAQQAQRSYQNAAQQARYVSENAMSGERVPLAYRGAVKDYFLNLNQRDP